MIFESVVADELGVQREVLRRLRVEKLKKGRDWHFEKRAVKLSEGAVRLLLAEMGVSEGETVKLLNRCNEAGGREKKGGGELVVRNFYRNRRIIGAEYEGELVRVRVRDSSRFIKGAVIECKHVDGTLWEFCGRIPRSKRNWKMAAARRQV